MPITYNVDFLDEENKKKPSGITGNLSTTINPQDLLGITSNIPVATRNVTTNEQIQYGGSAPIAQTSAQQPQKQSVDWFSGLGGILGNIGKWATENPALFTGLTTAVVGAGSGMQLGESLGIGGQAGMRVGQEQQRVYETKLENLAKLAALRGTAAGNQKTFIDYLSAARQAMGSKASPEQIQSYALELANAERQGTLPIVPEKKFMGIF